MNVKSSGTVVERLNSKGPARPGRSFQEFVKAIFKCLSSECSGITARFDSTVKIVCVTRFSFVQDSHHLRESPVRNRFHDTAVPRPILGRWAYLECVIDRRVTIHHHVDDSVRQLLGLVNFLPDPVFGTTKSTRRYCRCETFTRYVPANIGSFMKSLESDIIALQEQPINHKQTN